MRRRLGIEAGSEVDFQVEEESVRLVRRRGSSGTDVVTKMRGRAAGLSTDEIMAPTRGEW